MGHPESRQWVQHGGRGGRHRPVEQCLSGTYRVIGHEREKQRCPLSWGASVEDGADAIREIDGEETDDDAYQSSSDVGDSELEQDGQDVLEQQGMGPEYRE